ncbi:MAG TPA: outer membrane lipoprotein carrier protein LolA [Paludibaculum sp.]
MIQLPTVLSSTTRGALMLVLLGAHALPASPLDEALARLDKAAVGFKGLTASIKKISYTAIIKESTEEYGRMSLYRPKPKDLRMLVEFEKPEIRAVSFQNRKIQIFYPKLMTVQEYDLGKQASLVDQFLLLGFGTSSKDLLQSYDIKLTGEDALPGGKADRLDLVPKSEEARKSVKRIEIWISQADGVTVQQKVHQPSKDYVLISYADTKLNPAMTEDSVKLKLPKGVKKETPQK